MGFHKSLVRVLLLSVFVAGCPLEDEAQVDDGATNERTTGQSAGSNDDPDPANDDDDATGDAGGDTGGPGLVEPSDAGTEDLDAAVEMDAGGELVLDAGHDAGSVEKDAGTGIVAPDLGNAELADAERAKLIYDLIQAEGYVQNWFPYLQSNGDQRPLVAMGGHSSQVRVRQNAVAKQATDAWVAAGKPSPLVMPNGSIIVKESYKLVVVPVTDPPTPPTYTLNDIRVMAKVAVLDSGTYEGKWFYVKINTTTNVAERSTTCNGCHNGRTAKALWPVNPDIPMDPGGKPDALVPYDYLFVPFCSDPANELLCKPPA